MPRLARLDAPGTLHHVMIRGIERRTIFRSKADREDFLERLADILPWAQMACYAWVFMPNHAHFLFRTGNVPLSSVMRKLLTGYVINFNRRHKRTGQLFQNRYKSIVCQEDAYLRELVRYIHLNPIRAGILPSLKELNPYAYCGHSVLMGRKKRSWQDVDYVLGFFGTRTRNATKAYRTYVETGLEQGRRDELTGGGLIRSLGGWQEIRKTGLGKRDHVMSDMRILGDSNFVDSILIEANERYERGYELKNLGYDLNFIGKKVAEIYGLEPQVVFSKGKQRSRVKARSLFCFWAVRELGISLTELAVFLKMSVPGVGYAVERGEIIAQGNGFTLID